MGNDFGDHHRSSSSALVHASNARRAGPLMVLVTTSSRSDVRSVVEPFSVRAGSLTFVASIDLLLFVSLRQTKTPSATGVAGDPYRRVALPSLTRSSSSWSNVSSFQLVAPDAIAASSAS